MSDFVKDNNAFNGFFIPDVVGWLSITNNYHVAVYGKMPCRFHRFMARLLLGWKFEEVEKNEADNRHPTKSK